MNKIEVVYKNIDELIPYINNSRTHSDAQVAQIAASIKEFGWTNPVLMDGDNGIIAGHGRVLAARKLGQTEIPVIELEHLNDVQKRAYIIADNKLALNAGWDEDLLALELKDIENLGFDLSIIGFDEAEINPKNNDDVIVNDESRNLLMIELSSEQELQTIFDEMKNRGFECKILS
jgi:ParB-like chromosome segregation protein Spo0J